MKRILFAMLVALAVSGHAQTQNSSCSCHELAWQDHDVKIFRVTISPHSATSPFWHYDDYTFIPLSNVETLEAVTTGTTRNRSISERSRRDGPSWVVRNSNIRFVHPRETEPTEGQVLFNTGDQDYVALEILTEKPQSLPEFQSHFSLFGPSSTEAKYWLMGAYSIRLQSVASSDSIRFEHPVSGVLFAITPLNIGSDSNEPIGIKVGEPLPLKESANYRNLTNISTRVLILSKHSTELALETSASVSNTSAE